MPLIVDDVTMADLDILESQWNSPEGDLFSPVLGLTWPIDVAQNPEMGQARAKWSMKQQREIFLDDPTAKFIKAVDTDSGEILALARWHYYEHGYDPEQMGPWELNGRAPDAESTWPEGLNVELHRAFLSTIFNERPKWAGNHPQWVLTTLITRHGHRKKGAGFLLTEWGVRQAQKDGVPAYLEASKDGKPVYEKCGFKEVGRVTFESLPEHLGIEKDKYVTKMAANLDSK